jgi:TolA-binding protein
MRRTLLSLVVFSFLMISCAGSARPGGDEAAGSSARPAEATPAAEEESGLEVTPDEGQGREESPLPEVSIAVPAPEEEIIIEELAEPEIDLAEADLEPASPGEIPVSVALPEPELPVFPPVPAPVPPPQIAASPEDSPVSEPVPVVPGPPPAPPYTPPVQPSPQPVSPPVPAETPRLLPPAYLGPAEEERPPAIVREQPLAPESLPAAPQRPVEILPIPQPQAEEIVFSRTVRATVGQLVEIPFRGTGWVYLGELGSHRGIVYDSRRLDHEGQSFVFRTEAAGTYALKFYKQDFIRDFILNDHVQVIVGEASEVAAWFNPLGDRDRVTAKPRWPSSLEEAEMARQAVRPGAASSGSAPEESSARTASAMDTAGNMSIGTGAEAAAGSAAFAENTAAEPADPSNPAAVAGPAEIVDPTKVAGTQPQLPAGPASPAALNEIPELPAEPESFLQKAREEFDAGRVASAISLLDQFRERYPSGSDEACWLYGQFYEANSPSRDILAALYNYRRLVREYPQSSRYNDARRRIAYLERYYINIQ